MPTDSLTPDLTAFLQALIVGVVIGFAAGGCLLALSLIRSPKRGIGH